MKSINNNVGADSIFAQNGNKGITLIALIITIVVMLILVIVSVRIALDTGLFESAGKATKDWELVQEQEGELGNGKVNIGGTVYNSVEEYTNSISGGNAEVDFEKLFATAEKHPEQTKSNDIGIAEDGSIVNLDLWYYELIADDNEYKIGSFDGSMYVPGYNEENITEEGKIIGQVPMYIKQGGKTSFYPVTDMNATFFRNDSLTKAPVIPSSVTSMDYTFYECVSLIEAPVIPGSVTSMIYTFYECELLTEAPVIPDAVNDMSDTFRFCTSLTEAPAIPSSVTNMYYTFQGCTSLTKAPVIPSSVKEMTRTFQGCTSLTGTLTINANPTVYSNCLKDAATGEGCNLVLNGSSTKLNEILATAEGNPNITIGN